jgi:SNF2 family DNA or RNA helicase
VFKLYTRHSVEEKILALQQKKQQLIDSVIKPGKTCSRK